MMIKFKILLLAFLNSLFAESYLDDFSIKFNIDDNSHIINEPLISEKINKVSKDHFLKKSVHDTISTKMERKTYKIKLYNTNNSEIFNFIEDVKRFLIDNVMVLTEKNKIELKNWKNKYEKFKKSGNLNISLPSHNTESLYDYLKTNYEIIDHGLHLSQYSRNLKSMIHYYRELMKKAKEDSNLGDLNKSKNEIEKFRKYASQVYLYVYFSNYDLKLKEK